MPDLLKAFILGLVEGATEFIPVSSTGHLIIAADWLNFDGPGAATFEIVIQLGAILAIVWLYRARLFGALANARTDAAARRLILHLAIAFVPAAAVGFFFSDAIKRVLFDPIIVAGALVMGGFAILAIELWKPPDRVPDVDSMRPRDALSVGLAQVLSLVPGVSRSGATIMGGIVIGMSRRAATEFSFFVAVPIMIAATLYELIRNAATMQLSDVGVLAVGFVTAFASAAVVVRALVRFVSRHSFVVFAWYRVLFGGLLLYYYLR